MSRLAGKLVEMALSKQHWELLSIDGLVVLQSPLLLAFSSKMTHAFTTRAGGKTPSPLHSFNLGRHVEPEDLKADAIANRRSLCLTFHTDYEKLLVPGQVHSANVVTITNEKQHPSLKSADALVTDLPKNPVLLQFADCVPIILFDAKQFILSVVHAGWQGTAASIAKNAVKAMIDRHASQPHDIHAAIGPAIGSCCYPTSDEIAQQLKATICESDRLIGRKPSSGQYRPDLKAINAMQLFESGLEHIDVSSECTACRPEMFYSHRQSQGKTGRQGAFAELL